MKKSQTDIFTRATNSALHALATASDAVLTADTVRYPHLRLVSRVINEAVELLDKGRDVKPVESLMTVFIFDDAREWNDPYIAIIDAIGLDTAEDLRGVIQAHYFETFCPAEEMADTTADQYWADKGGVIQAVIPGAVQVGWQVGGVDSHLLESAMEGFKGGM